MRYKPGTTSLNIHLDLTDSGPILQIDTELTNKAYDLVAQQGALFLDAHREFEIVDQTVVDVVFNNGTELVQRVEWQATVINRGVPQR